MLNPPETPVNDLKGDESTEEAENNISLILEALDDKQWGDHFMDLKNKIQTEVPEIPMDIKVQKIFAIMRGLCWGTEAATSLTLFEGKYYDMEQRIKSRRNGNLNCTVSSENIVNLAVGYVSAKLSDNFGFARSKNPNNKLNQTDCSTPHKQQSTYSKYEPDKGIICPEGNLPALAYSDFGVGLGRHHDELPAHLAPPRSSSNHYISPSAKGPANNLQPEASSHGLSPAKNSREFKVIRRDKHLGVAPSRPWNGSEHAPCLPHSHIPSSIAQKPSRLPFLYKKKELPQIPNVRIVISKPEVSGFVRPESNIPVTLSSVPNPLSMLITNPGYAKALPPLPQDLSLSPSLRHELKRGRESTPLKEGEEKLGGTITKSQDTPPAESFLPPTTRISDPSIVTIDTAEADHQCSKNFSGRSPTPTAESSNTIAQNNISGSTIRSSYPQVGTPITKSGSPINTINTDTQISHMVASKISNKAASVDVTGPSTINGSLGSGPERSERSSCLGDTVLGWVTSSSEVSRMRYQTKLYGNEKLSHNSRNYSPEPHREVPKIVNIVRSPKGAANVAPTDDIYGRKIRLEMGMKALASTNTVTSPVDPTAKVSVNGLETYTPTIKDPPQEYTISKIPNFSRQTRNKTPTHESNPKAQYLTKSVSKGHLNAHGDMVEVEKSEGLNQVRGPGIGVGYIHSYIPGQITVVGRMQNSNIPRLSPRPRVNSTNDQQCISLPEHGGSSHRAISEGENITGPKNIVASGVERNYMRLLAKSRNRQEHSSPRKPSFSGGSWAVFSESPPKFGGRLPYNERSEPSSPTNRGSKGLESAGMEETIQHSSTETSLAPPESIKKSSFHKKTRKPGGTGRPTVDKTPIFTIDGKKPSNTVLVDITEIGTALNPRMMPIACAFFGGAPGMSGAIIGPPTRSDSRKENFRLVSDDQQDSPQPISSEIVGSDLGAFEDFASPLNRGPPKFCRVESGNFPRHDISSKSKDISSPVTPHGEFSQDEVENLMKKLSAQLPQTPNEKNAFNTLGGRYYTFNIPSLEKSPSKDEKKRNPIAVCMELINAASNEPQSARREILLQMSRVMVDAVSKSRDAECAAEEAERAAERAEVAFLKTRKHLALMTELMKNRKQDI